MGWAVLVSGVSESIIPRVFNPHNREYDEERRGVDERRSSATSRCEDPAGNHRVPQLGLI